MKDIPLIEKIDDVLYALSNATYPITENNIFKLLYEKSVEITHRELEAMLAKLVKDGYIVQFTLPLGTDITYQITFDGMMIAYEGGYESLVWLKNKNVRLEKNQIEMQKTQTEMMTKQLDIMSEQTQIQKSVKALTKWIAIATIIAAIYYSVELLKIILKL
jgi:hypothetical protein